MGFCGVDGCLFIRLSDSDYVFSFFLQRGTRTPLRLSNVVGLLATQRGRDLDRWRLPEVPTTR